MVDGYGRGRDRCEPVGRGPGQAFLNPTGEDLDLRGRELAGGRHFQAVIMDRLE